MHGADTGRVLTGNNRSLAFVMITGGSPKCWRSSSYPEKMKTLDNVHRIFFRNSLVHHSSNGGLIELSALPMSYIATLYIPLDRGNSGNSLSRPSSRLLRGVLTAMQGQLSYLRLINPMIGFESDSRSQVFHCAGAFFLLIIYLRIMKPFMIEFLLNI